MSPTGTRCGASSAASTRGSTFVLRAQAAPVSLLLLSLLLFLPEQSIACLLVVLFPHLLLL